MKEYHKISTLYNRATDGSKKLIEGDWQDPTVEFLKDAEWEFTEKIDGSNTSVHWDGHKVRFAGRTADASMPVGLVNYLVETFCSEDVEQLFEQKFGETEVVLFGEGYGGRIQNGKNYRPDESFILFDVFIAGNWQPRESVEDIAQAFGLDVVPIVLRGTLDDAVEFVKGNPASTIGTAKMEGVVGRPKVELRDRAGNRVIVKIKGRDFK